MTKKTKPSIKLGFKSGISIVTAVFLFAIILKNSTLASLEVKSALKICSNLLIPSLFPLMVASEIMTNSGAIEKITHKLSTPIAKILGVSKSAAAPYFLGLLGGYSSACQSAMILYQNGKISKRDLESIISLSNIPSLAFMTGFVGVGILKSSTVGWIIWGIAVLSTLLLGIINNIFSKNDVQIYIPNKENKKDKREFSRILVNSIIHSAHSMLTICACVIFFSVLIAVLKLYATKVPIPEQAKGVILGSLEITNGIGACSIIESTPLRALACAFLVGWSGFCVHFQVIALCEDSEISFKKYFIFKALQGLICLLLALVAFGI